jgi:hypothetical protein
MVCQILFKSQLLLNTLAKTNILLEDGANQFTKKFQEHTHSAAIHSDVHLITKKEME